MTTIIITLLLLGAGGMTFFSSIYSALEVCDRLVLEIETKNRHIPQGVVFRPVDNHDLCTTLMHTGLLVSQCIVAISSTLLSLVLFDSGLERIVFLIIIVLAATFLLKNIPSAIAAKRSIEVIKKLTPTASALSNLIYPWLYVVLFSVVAHANKRGEDNFYELMPFQGISTKNEPDNYTGHDFKILKKALDFTNIKIRECLIPRNEIVYADIHDDIPTLTKLFTDSNFSKILICDKTIDNVAGYVNALSLFNNPISIKQILTPVIEVPETMTAEKLFKLFIKRRLSVAIVIDEYGGTAGMLTIEDIIEEITGEIKDEHDNQTLTEKKISENEYQFSGRLEIDYINEKYSLGMPKTDEYETLAGYVLKLKKDLPTTGDQITDGKFTMKIDKVKRQKIDLITLQISQETAQETNNQN